MTTLLFPLPGYWWAYAAFTGLVVLLLAADLALHRKEQPVSFRNAAVWTAVWVAAALLFGYVLYRFAASALGPALGRRTAMEYFAGYIVEESLSVDNMFVFALVFRHFDVPARYQHRVLFFGVLGAMVFRGLFIAAGAALIRFQPVLIAFGVFLIYSGVRLIFEKESRLDPGRSRIVRAAGRVLPVTSEYQGARFFTRLGGRLFATPLLLVLLFLESTDVVFAIDSVPAVFGVTREPFVVYSSNIFAVLGLRSLFFLLAGALDRFRLLKYGLSAVLVFVGLKMVWLDHLAGGRFPIGVSLIVIAAMLGIPLLASLPHARRAVSPESDI